MSKEYFPLGIKVVKSGTETSFSPEGSVLAFSRI